VTFEKVEIRPINAEGASGLSIQEALQKDEVKQIVAAIEQRSTTEQAPWKAHDDMYHPTKPALDIDTEAKKVHRKLIKQASFSDQELSDNEDYAGSPAQNWSWGWGRLPVQGDGKAVSSFVVVRFGFVRCHFFDLYVCLSGRKIPRPSSFNSNSSNPPSVDLTLRSPMSNNFSFFLSFFFLLFFCFVLF